MRPPRRPTLAIALVLLLAAATACRPAHAFALQDVKAAADSILDQIKSKITSSADAGGAAAAAPADRDAAVAEEAFASITGADDDSTVGAQPAATRSSSSGSSSSSGVGKPKIRTLSWQPRAMLWEGFMTQEGAAAACRDLQKRWGRGRIVCCLQLD